MPAEPTRLQRWTTRLGELFAARQESPKVCFDENAALVFQRELAAWNQMQPSDQERMQMIRDALQTQFGNADRNVVVTDVFSEPRLVVFFFHGPMGAHPPGAEYFRSKYEQGQNNGFTFSEPERVRRMTTYEPVGNTTGQQDPDGPAPAGNHTAAGEAAMSDKDKEQGLAEQVAALVTAVQNLTTEVGLIKTEVAKPDPAIAELKGTVTQLSEQVAAVQTVTAPAIAERERERQALVQALTGNERVPFTAAELESKPIDELRKIAMLAQVVNYAGRGGPQAGNGAEPQFAEPVPYFTKQQTKGGE